MCLASFTVKLLNNSSSFSNSPGDCDESKVVKKIMTINIRKIFLTSTPQLNALAIGHG